MSKEVAFVGLGYIGLPTAVVLANSGVDVTGIDVKKENVERINRGEITIVEPGLEEGLKSALESGKFRATTEMVHANAYIIAVPTPFTDDYNVDMKFIYSVAESLAPQLKGDELVILESTSPPKTTRRMAERILSLRPDLIADGEPNPENKPVLYFAHCPERILPGKAMEELITNDRIIGGETDEATRRATEIYASFCTGKLLPTDAVTAEMAKLTENSFRDVNIAFANELSLICDNLDINVWELIELANHHPRVNILQPGPGVGGHCIAVDPWFIVAADPQNSRLIRTAREVNDGKPRWVVDKVAEALSSHQAGAKIATLGMAFKADIDDLRESPALNITKDLADRFSECTILAVEPNVDQLPDDLDDKDNVTLTPYRQAIADADVVVVLVDHQEFKDVSATQLKGKTIIDTKGLWI
ncbi:UDP-N-acetyl-D-mannosamine dehydrogenase [Corynebacterium glutamicum]|uniref:UDP-N-acetyl-D-mannosamine dehydrogenase n=1 Tax=Corynebacterium glutamicum TaxID=1718 RepID=UPI000720290F|nr:UDP-N-acetyl-D-mannosamine dehydrogenase [Corynebacterium glutamicum]ALP49147.1 UDP-N-acetyl-D-mannosaminuronic acid dehydrogenase [Corynebacterium glutamicum]ANU32659.1 UDP-N-acetyl-D-mannosaminuronic acid dehydrogenase [Corynebacterium glutamicum]APT06401.1 UDP-N-acetyl-D-mannosamine dehydrogenase [Corynebacterium glutamicum]QWQ83325.1 UDP-N-acetyl-D-mannosamine dehydrogenase [Corynebacterium glutamicum]WFP71307.1 UDP-N-acetyl-D-mannosamine dehydrogenase [Corynebacterium glutamicum]